MNEVYRLTHRRLLEVEEDTQEEVCDVKLLGFFSSQKKCEEAVKLYLGQPGFMDYPERFFVDKIEADINDYCDCLGEFEECVYFLAHEWYDGEYDYVSYLGYYSSYDKAQKAKEQYSMEPEFIKHPDGFGIDKYVLDEREWKEGFFVADVEY